VKLRNSDAYLEQMERASSDVPHVACRAEASISAQHWYLRETEPTTMTIAPGIVVKSMTPYDQRILTPRGDIGKMAGDYRVMGVGRGVDAEDCARAAVQACDDAIDGYWRKQLAVRPLGIPCRLLSENAQCPASGSYEPAVASEPKVAPRSEPPLVSLVKKLDDKRTRRDAVRGLVQFFENAKSRAHGDVADPEVRALLDKIVEPLANTYGDGDLDDATRGDLIRVLGESSDARAGRAWAKAFASFSAGKPAFEEDVAWAAHGVAASHHQESAASLGEAFAKLEAGAPQSARAGKTVRLAMVALKNPGWKAMLIDKMGHPIESAASTGYKNELYWQGTAAEVLGEMGDAGATRALVKIMMDPHKKALEKTALVALVAIGKDAIPSLSDILAGKDAELVELGKARASENDGDPRSFVRVAARALGAIGRAEAKDALLRAQKGPDSPANYAAIARAFTGLPPSADATKGFLFGYEKAPAPQLRADLLDAAGDLYDAERVPWLLAQAKATQATYVRQAAMRSALKSMKPAQVAAVKATVDKIGSDAEKGELAASSRLFDRCTEQVACYLDALGEPEGDGKDAPLKAAAMIATIGDPDAAMKLIGRLVDLRSRAVRLAALGAVDHLVKKDGAAAADALMKTLDDGADDEVRSATKLVALRLRAR
jgi:hypothetical protein